MNFSIKKIYNFDTLAPTILNNHYKNMKVIGIVDSTEAVKYADILTLHNKISNIIPSIPKNVKDLTYILFENTDGKHVLMAYEYIELSSITEVKSINIVIKISNALTSDVAIIRKALTELGYAVEIQTT